MAKIIWQARVFAGGPLFAASTATQVTVIDKSNDTLASLWSDRDGTSVKANPFFITVAGKIEMYLDPGRYRVTAVNAGQTDTWDDVLIIDPDAGGGGGGGSYPSVTEATTARTLVLSDAQKFIDCTNASGCAITVPPQSSVSWVADTEILGLGRLDNVTFIEPSGVTIIKPSDRILECYAGAPWALRRLASNIWSLTGYLVEA